MNTKGNAAALGLVFILLFFALLVPQVQGLEIDQNLSCHSDIVTKTYSYEATIPEAIVYNAPDLLDFQKGAHYNLAYAEGESIHLSIIISNAAPFQYTVEGIAFMRVKATPDDTWTELWSDTATDTVNGGSSKTATSEPTDFTSYGWFQTGTQLHFGIGYKTYPTADPSDWDYIGFSVWFSVVNGASPANGGDETQEDTTEDSNGTPDEYSYSGALAFIDPLANILGLPRIATLVVSFMIILCICAIIVLVITRETETCSGNSCKK